MANRWENIEKSDRLYFLGFQNYCRWRLQPWNSKMLASLKKSYDQPRQHVKSRDITLLKNVHLVKAMIFPVVMYGCESWTIKKPEHWRIGAFELWCWRRLSRICWSKKSNQSILREISSEYSLEGLMLKLQYLGHMMQRKDSLEKTLILGQIEGRRRRGQQKMNGWMASLTQWTGVWASSGSWWWIGKPGVLQSMGLQRAGRDWATELNCPYFKEAFNFQVWTHFDRCLNCRGICSYPNRSKLQASPIKCMKQ